MDGHRRRRDRYGRDTLADELGGFAVEALDGRVGTLQRTTTEASEHHLTIGGVGGGAERLVMLPLSVIDRIEPGSRTVHVDLTRSQIEKAPRIAWTASNEANEILRRDG
ncbi:MAG: hypothetical protein H0U86_00890 [Chloroflexi bacterium]|nr:hypothetical protein [Chloroflexota bacterium]